MIGNHCAEKKNRQLLFTVKTENKQNAQVCFELLAHLGRNFAPENETDSQAPTDRHEISRDVLGGFGLLLG